MIWKEIVALFSEYYPDILVKGLGNREKFRSELSDHDGNFIDE
jgi:hypothetical protein